MRKQQQHIAAAVHGKMDCSMSTARQHGLVEDGWASAVQSSAGDSAAGRQFPASHCCSLQPSCATLHMPKHQQHLPLHCLPGPNCRHSTLPALPVHQDTAQTKMIAKLRVCSSPPVPRHRHLQPSAQEKTLLVGFMPQHTSTETKNDHYEPEVHTQEQALPCLPCS